ncbi:hypothetical protein F5Y16DRAFT_401084 [Xylariaceae sp. FL0255]|nr:hypothetical protein F5Y16DRAFT_401084 [Xylariaceae sp. FL0255]
MINLPPWAEDGSSQVVSEAASQSHPEPKSSSGQSDSPGQSIYKQDILNLLKPITEKYARGIQLIADTVAQASQAQIPEAVRRCLEAWTMSTQSERLWIQGVYETTHPSNATFTAVSLVALANNNKIPCLSYFCSLGVHGTLTAQSLTCQDMLTDMIKSLIVQVLLLLPDDLEMTPTLAPLRFETLLESQVDIEKAMLLFRDLRVFLPPYIHCVIDAAQEVEDRSDLAHTQSLCRVLRMILDIPNKSDKQEKAHGKVLKGCIMSDGYVDVLGVLAERAYVDKLEVSDTELEEDGPGLISQWERHDN